MLKSHRTLFWVLVAALLTVSFDATRRCLKIASPVNSEGQRIYLFISGKIWLFFVIYLPIAARMLTNTDSRVSRGVERI